jgi:hypothetical protein
MYYATVYTRIINAAACSQSASVNWLASEWVMMHLSQSISHHAKANGWHARSFPKQNINALETKAKVVFFLTLKFRHGNVEKWICVTNFKVKVSVEK